MSLVSRAFVGESDLELLIEFARRATAARSPGTTYWHAGDIVWQVFPYVGADVVDDIRLWFDDGVLAGFVLFEPPLRFEFDVSARSTLDHALLSEMLAWSEGRRGELLREGAPDTPRAYAALGEQTIATTALESDVARIAALRRHGYEADDGGATYYARSLDVAIPESRLPEGMRLRHATDADLEQRVDLHRDAWSVWGPSSATVEAYRRLRGAPLYQQDLDVVIESGDGRLVSYCICWVDGTNGVATFEPVGTRPEFAGRGLAREVIFEALQRLRDRGMRRALVSTASVNERAMRLYPSCGFEVADRGRFYVKPL